MTKLKTVTSLLEVYKHLKNQNFFAANSNTILNQLISSIVEYIYKHI